MNININVPRPVLYGIGVLLAIGATVGITLAVSRGGDDDGHVATVTTSAPSTGTSDGAAISTTTEAEPEPATDDCDALGINPQELNEGRCVEGKQELVIVNKDSTLKLDQLTATLGSIETTPTLETGLGGPKTADGTYVLVRLGVTNTTSSPKTFDSTGDIAAMALCNDVYTEDFNISNNPGVNSFVWDSDPIQPNETHTGTLIFDVPTDAAACIAKNGNLNIGNFRDDYGFGKVAQLGVFRTYH